MKLLDFARCCCEAAGCNNFGFLHLVLDLEDVTDPERSGIHVENVPYYYNKYFRKTFQVELLDTPSMSLCTDVTLREKHPILRSTS